MGSHAMKPFRSSEELFSNTLSSTPCPYWHWGHVGESRDTTRTESLDRLNQSRNSAMSRSRIVESFAGASAFFSPLTVVSKPVFETDSAIFFGSVREGS